ncbi:aromatic ring-hydroxylating dioxygenase subunit alpha [Sphingomonas naphthae]|uniref:Aromatic ring-hydroxylating dioxygenase subunit alpha n=1 Tax=Sphingomonas naphthae TaxID=1813468 RepID=A0ABY7TKM0_9SPHN|nr:aromatic ring-hydroxylating dioxygenase subunit alpha [Sphingomonas naphthae]WCT73500.1 aromatic ring-hydroxylating dioxygenase subunit alpha [Sphingomonas naphthae]
MNKPFSLEVGAPVASEEDLAKPLTYPTEAFLSKDYAEAEKKLLWPKVWQMACRLEEIPEVGNFITYEIGDDSIIVVRSAPDEIKAFHNVCPHRGRRLIDTPCEQNGACGTKRRFVCGFHGWAFDLEGKNVYILDPQDWKGALTEGRTGLSEVQVDHWGGWVFINMDPNCVPLREFLEPAASILDAFQFEKMRYKWRQWVIYPANWKTALEAFMEPYHVSGTHSQLLKYGQFYAYSKSYGLHGVSGFDERDASMKMSQSSTVTRAGLGGDPRVSTYELARENYTTVNYAASTETLVNAASRLVDELPEGTSPGDVVKHWLASAKADDAKRGVIWPEISAENMAEAGLAWHVFPNMSLLQGATFALCYRARPYGDDPDKCIFESYAIERFPEGEVPRTEWVHAEATAEKWGSVLAQDFANMEWVQKGMKSRGFRGTLPNPHQEQKITNFHRNLAQYMGMGGPRLLD